MYKVGDYVRIRNDMVADTKYGRFWFNPAMARYRGSKARIINVRNWVYTGLHYKLCIDQGFWSYSAEMLEGVD